MIVYYKLLMVFKKRVRHRYILFSPNIGFTKHMMQLSKLAGLLSMSYGVLGRVGGGGGGGGGEGLPTIYTYHMGVKPTFLYYCFKLTC